jgi:hypothetical protein
MIRFAAPLRALAACLVCALLAACGGGGGGGSNNTPDTGGGGSAESAYLLAEFVAADVNHQVVRVWDPAQPSTTVQSVSVVQDSGIAWTATHLVFADATSYDVATRTATTLGHARVFFDNNGKLYTIDLRGGHSHAPVQLSSATDVVRPVKAFPMNAAGDDAWVDVQGAGHHWAVRTTAGAGDAPVSVLKVVAALRDVATGLPQYFLASLGSVSGTAVQPTTWQVFSAAFAQVSVAAVAAMDGLDGWVGADPVQAGLGYLAIDGELRALRWSASGVSVDTGVLHAFSNSLLGAPPAVAGDATLYVADDVQLLAVANGVVTALGSFGAAPDLLVDAGAYVAAREPVIATSSATDHVIETIAKASHATTIVEAATDGVQLLGAAGDTLVLAGTAEQGQAFVLARGDNTARSTVGAQYVGLVLAAAAPLDRGATPVGLLSCVAATTGTCGAGALTQTSIATGAATTLGTLAASASIVQGNATAGLTGTLAGQTLLPASTGLGTNEVNVRDAWQFLPASAGSLTRVTSYLP